MESPKNGHSEAQKLRIYIDRQPRETLNPTTGQALYELGEIPAHRELFREAYGDNEEVTIPRTEVLVHLKENEHFYSQKEYSVIVNAEERKWPEARISYEDVVHLAFPNPPSNVVITYTVEYERGPKENREGSMVKGQSVKIKKGMVFCVTETGRS